MSEIISNLNRDVNRANNQYGSSSFLQLAFVGIFAVVASAKSGWLAGKAAEGHAGLLRSRSWRCARRA